MSGFGKRNVVEKQTAQKSGKVALGKADLERLKSELRDQMRSEQAQSNADAPTQAKPLPDEQAASSQKSNPVADLIGSILTLIILWSIYSYTGSYEQKCDFNTSSYTSKMTCTSVWGR